MKKPKVTKKKGAKPIVSIAIPPKISKSAIPPVPSINPMKPSKSKAKAAKATPSVFPPGIVLPTAKKKKKPTKQKF